MRSHCGKIFVVPVSRNEVHEEYGSGGSGSKSHESDEGHEEYGSTTCLRWCAEAPEDGGGNRNKHKMRNQA